MSAWFFFSLENFDLFRDKFQNLLISGQINVNEEWEYKWDGNWLKFVEWKLYGWCRWWWMHLFFNYKDLSKCDLIFFNFFISKKCIGLNRLNRFKIRKNKSFLGLKSLNQKLDKASVHKLRHSKISDFCPHPSLMSRHRNAWADPRPLLRA